jgi:thioredoxin-like negative regulator of GroEL
MTGLLTVISALATAGKLPEDQSYKAAYRQHRDEGKPLVVLVGADWCPACRSMKTVSLPDAARHGALRDVAVAVVDVDTESSLAGRLMRGGSIPQLVMFYQDGTGSHRAQLTGAQDAETIEQFVAERVRTTERSAGSAAPTRSRVLRLRVSSGGS